MAGSPAAAAGGRPHGGPPGLDASHAVGGGWLPAPGGGASRSLLAPALALAWAVAFGCRAGIFAVAPALPAIERSLRLGDAQAQSVFTAPVVVMGLLSIPGGLLADRVGTWGAVALGLGLVVVGGCARVAVGGFLPLLALAAVMGAGIGLVQPALPKFVRERFPERIQLATGVYTSGFVTGSALGGWLTAAYGADLAGGWREALLAWGLLPVVFLILWLRGARGGTARPRRPAADPGAADAGVPASRQRAGPADLPLATATAGGQWAAVARGAAPPASSRTEAIRGGLPWGRRATWLTAGIGLAQAVAFYTLTAWLPTYLAELGWAPSRIAGVYGVFEVAAIPPTVLAPWLMERIGRRRLIMAVSAGLFLVGTVGFAAAPGRAPYVWALLAGATNTVPFVLSLALPAELAPPGQVAGMSGVVLTVSYAGAFLGPPLAGVLRQTTGHPVAGLVPAAAAVLALLALAPLVPEHATAAAPGPA